MDCVNATAYGGITFWARGSVPGAATPNTMTVVITGADTLTPAEGGTCATAPCTRPKYDFTVTGTWQQFPVTWANFTAGVSGATTVTPAGDNITGIEFQVANNDQANEIEIAVDDVAFLAR
jgi:hypothetical protein